MTYTEHGDEVTLKMTLEDYGFLMYLLGFALAASGPPKTEHFRRCLDFINRLNTGNPHFTPYEIPGADNQQ